MIVNDIKPGQFFCFNGDTAYPHIRTETGFADLLSEEHYTGELNRKATVIERWVVERVMIPYEIAPQELSDICGRLLEENKTPVPVYTKPLQIPLFGGELLPV